MGGKPSKGTKRDMRLKANRKTNTNNSTRAKGNPTLFRRKAK